MPETDRLKIIIRETETVALIEPEAEGRNGE